jgi:hypothetical protein
VERARAARRQCERAIGVVLVILVLLVLSSTAPHVRARTNVPFLHGLWRHYERTIRATMAQPMAITTTTTTIPTTTRILLLLLLLPPTIGPQQQQQQQSSSLWTSLSWRIRSRPCIAHAASRVRIQPRSATTTTTKRLREPRGCCC